MKFDLTLKENEMSLILKVRLSKGSPEDVLVERMVRHSEEDVEGRLTSNGGAE